MYSRDAGKWEKKVWNRLIAYPDTTFHNAYPSALDLKNIMDLGNSGKSGVGEAGNETRATKEAGVDVRGIFASHMEGKEIPTWLAMARTRLSGTSAMGGGLFYFVNSR